MLGLQACAAILGPICQWYWVKQITFPVKIYSCIRENRNTFQFWNEKQSIPQKTINSNTWDIHLCFYTNIYVWIYPSKPLLLKIPEDWNAQFSIRIFAILCGAHWEAAGFLRREPTFTEQIGLLCKTQISARGLIHSENWIFPRSPIAWGVHFLPVAGLPFQLSSTLEHKFQ